jgi:hypothetical protein
VQCAAEPPGESAVPMSEDSRYTTDFDALIIVWPITEHGQSAQAVQHRSVRGVSSSGAALIVLMKQSWLIMVTSPQTDTCWVTPSS